MVVCRLRTCTGSGVVIFLFLGLALRLPSGLRQEIKGVYVLPEGAGGVSTESGVGGGFFIFF